MTDQHIAFDKHLWTWLDEMINNGDVPSFCRVPELELIEPCKPTMRQDLALMITIKDGVRDDIWIAGLTVGELVGQFVQLIARGVISVSYELIDDESEER